MDLRIYVVAFFSGIFLHACLFSSYEWDRHATSIVISAHTFYAAIVALLSIRGMPFGLSFIVAFELETLLLSGLSCSIVTYRLFLHPLRSIPGPLIARLTSLWIIRENIPRLNFYVKLRSLHDQYGDFVRIRKCLCGVLSSPTDPLKVLAKSQSAIQMQWPMYMDLGTTSGKANSTTTLGLIIRCNSFATQAFTKNNVATGIELSTTRVSHRS
jgi:hypothetical protein